MDMYTDNMYRHVYRHAYKNVYRHACRRRAWKASLLFSSILLDRPWYIRAVGVLADLCVQTCVQICICREKCTGVWLDMHIGVWDGSGAKYYLQPQPQHTTTTTYIQVSRRCRVVACSIKCSNFAALCSCQLTITLYSPESK